MSENKEKLRIEFEEPFFTLHVYTMKRENGSYIKGVELRRVIPYTITLTNENGITYALEEGEIEAEWHRYREYLPENVDVEEIKEELEKETESKKQEIIKFFEKLSKLHNIVKKTIIHLPDEYDC